MALFLVVRIRRIRFLQSEGVQGTGSVSRTWSTEGGDYSAIRYSGLDGVEREFNTRGTMSGEQEIVYDPDNPQASRSRHQPLRGLEVMARSGGLHRCLSGMVDRRSGRRTFLDTLL